MQEGSIKNIPFDKDYGFIKNDKGDYYFHSSKLLDDTDFKDLKKGDSVKKDQELLILEAMKMRNRIFAPSAGKISKISVKDEENVSQDQILIEIEA